MTKMIIRCLEEGDGGARICVPGKEAFLDGYTIGERQLEGVPIRIFHAESGELDVEIALPDETIRQLFIDREEVRKEVFLRIMQGYFDVLASTTEIADDKMCIYDDTLPLESQAFRAAPDFEIRDAKSAPE